MTFESTNRNTQMRPAPSAPDRGNASSGIAEAGGFLVIAVVAMALLAFGYKAQPPGTGGSIQATQSSSPNATTGNASPATGNPATNNASNANPSTALGATPQTQPRAPGNNTPSAPTSSTTGAGADNGSTGTPTSK